jgi:hypothetical protein
MDSFVFVDTSLLRWAGGVHTSLWRKPPLKLDESAAIGDPTRTLEWLFKVEIPQTRWLALRRYGKN